MNNFPTQPAFPEWAFPPIARAAVLAVQASTQAPLALIASSALAAMSLAVQDKVNVRRLNGLKSCCSLFLISICDSGERKTSVDRLFTAPIVKFQQQEDALYKEKVAKFTTEKKIWSIKQRSIAKLIDKAFSTGEPTGRHEKLLEAHAQNEPKLPPTTKLLYSDVTPAAFLYGLHQNTKSAGIFDDEAGRIFNGPLVDDLGLLIRRGAVTRCTSIGDLPNVLSSETLE